MKLFKYPIFVLAISCVAVSASGQVPTSQLETRDGLMYLAGTDKPYTGAVLDPGETQGNVKDGKRVGQWLSWYPDGEKRMEFNYNDGLPASRTLWHENGTISSKTLYDDDGKITNWMRHWDDNGTLREEHEWLAGVEHGKARLFDHKGNLQRSATYRDGEKDGAEIWYYADGSKLWETRYEMGERTGTWTQYNPKGELTAQSTWQKGKLVSRVNPHEGH